MLDRLTDRLSNRLSDRSIDRLTGKLSDRLTDRLTDKLIDLLTDKLTDKLSDRLTNRHKQHDLHWRREDASKEKESGCRRGIPLESASLWVRLFYRMSTSVTNQFVLQASCSNLFLFAKPEIGPGDTVVQNSQEW